MKKLIIAIIAIFALVSFARSAYHNSESYQIEQRIKFAERQLFEAKLDCQHKRWDAEPIINEISKYPFLADGLVKNLRKLYNYDEAFDDLDHSLENAKITDNWEAFTNILWDCVAIYELKHCGETFE